jgi:hypothetical protein
VVDDNESVPEPQRQEPHQIIEQQMRFANDNVEVQEEVPHGGNETEDGQIAGVQDEIAGVTNHDIALNENEGSGVGTARSGPHLKVDRELSKLRINDHTSQDKAHSTSQTAQRISKMA